jgi:hypothetical protein
MKRKIIMGLLLLGAVAGIGGGVARLAFCAHSGGWHHAGRFGHHRSYQEERMTRLCAEAALNATERRHRRDLD